MIVIYLFHGAPFYKQKLNEKGLMKNGIID